nr:MAG TPA: hypothetical protein [Caudoviricetes sp.]
MAFYGSFLIKSIYLPSADDAILIQQIEIEIERNKGYL